MSRETTQARGALQAAEHEWAAHRGLCGQCSRAVRDRTTRYGLCGQGAPLRDEVRRLTGEVETSRLLDAQPITGQERLF